MFLFLFFSGAILNQMATRKITLADVGYGGTQLKMQLTLEGSQKVAFKPKWSVHYPLYTAITLFMHPANERWCYIVTSSLIGLVHTQNDPCLYTEFI